MGKEPEKVPLRIALVGDLGSTDNKLGGGCKNFSGFMVVKEKAKRGRNDGCMYVKISCRSLKKHSSLKIKQNNFQFQNK